MNGYRNHSSDYELVITMDIYTYNLNPKRITKCFKVELQNITRLFTCCQYGNLTVYTKLMPLSVQSDQTTNLFEQL